jgi:hypothetical protein
VTKKKAGFLLPLFAALTLAAPALAQDDGSLAQSSSPPERTSVLYTYGDEPCPEAGEGEIVVCAQRPESERYRVPKELREELKEDEAVGGGSWASKVEGYENVARASRPNSCSPVGSYGFTGCAAASLRDWFEARRAP